MSKIRKTRGYSGIGKSSVVCRDFYFVILAESDVKDISNHMDVSDIQSENAKIIDEVFNMCPPTMMVFKKEFMKTFCEAENEEVSLMKFLDERKNKLSKS